jgi:hypothetical protein
MPDAPHDPPRAQSFAAHIEEMRRIAHDAKRPVDRTRTLLDTYDDTELPEGDQA